MWVYISVCGTGNGNTLWVARFMVALSGRHCIGVHILVGRFYEGSVTVIVKGPPTHGALHWSSLLPEMVGMCC